MPRPRERVCLQDGLKGFEPAARQGFMRPGLNVGPRRIRWTHSYWGEIASGISVDMNVNYEGWLRIQLGSQIAIGLTAGKPYDVVMLRHLSVLRLASRANRSALRRLWFSWNSGSAWRSAIVCRAPTGFWAFRSVSSAICCSAVRFGLVIADDPCT